MEDILNKEPVKRVQKKLNEFSNELKAIVLNSSARTAQQAAESLNTEVGSIVKSLLFKNYYNNNEYYLCLISGDKILSINKLSKIIGEKTIGYDRFQRRIGMVYAAQNTLEEVKKDSNSYANLIAYTNGVNKYIESLNENKIPLEYKILNYKPEKWTLLKTSLLFVLLQL